MYTDLADPATPFKLARLLRNRHLDAFCLNDTDSDASVALEQAALLADFLPLYRTIELRPERPEGDLVLLASASAARAFGALGANLPAVSIGPQTSRAAREVGIRVLAEAERHDLGGLVDAVARLSL